MSQTAIAPPKHVSTVRKVFAAILDLIFAVTVFGYAIAWVAGTTTAEGFHLDGGPALLMFALIILYFIVCPRFLGGTVFQRLLRTR